MMHLIREDATPCPGQHGELEETMIYVHGELAIEEEPKMSQECESFYVFN